MATRMLVVLAALLALTGCDSTRSLKELRTAAPSSDPYAQALAENYRDFAEDKLDAYDWWTSKYFADKGLMAAYGRDITPEDPALWDLSAHALPSMQAARANLMGAIASQRASDPELVAAATVSYDRLVELQYAGASDDAIAEEYQIFQAILEKLKENATLAEAAAQAAAATQTAAPAESTSTILYFPKNSAAFEEASRAAFEELVRYIREAGNVSVHINGHSDRAGNDAINMNLSERRAKFVMGALKAAGIPEKIMQYFAFGETDPAVPTADGVEEPKNRRVEVFLE